MTITLTAYGIAKDILGARSQTITCQERSTIADLKGQLTDHYPAFADLRHFQIAANESYQSDDYIVQAGDELVIIPPVSGG